jgi:hypothetical protein
MTTCSFFREKTGHNSGVERGLLRMGLLHEKGHPGILEISLGHKYHNVPISYVKFV